MNIERLIEISQDLGLINEAEQLKLIKQRSDEQECELIMPLVGEFSSGKTTLINALLDSTYKLETARKETTATLFEIHFGCDKCEAEVIYNNGSKKTTERFDELRNEELKD